MATVLRQIFIGTKCEACGDWKRKNTAFCSGCYFRLPTELRDALWHRFGEGFEEAYVAGLNWLRADDAETDRLLREP